MKIGVINPYPEYQNAEKEYIERFGAACQDTGHELVRLAPDGRKISPDWEISDEVIGIDEVDFTLSLHHDTPKLFDTWMYGVLWVPLREWLNEYTRKRNYILSWDDKLRSDSPIINAYVSNALDAAGFGPGLNPLETLIVCNDRGIEPRRLATPKIFYAGTNWDRGMSGGGRNAIRHEGLFKRLDETGLVAFYGPKNYVGSSSGQNLLRGTWDGYECYRGELPFDGRSFVPEIAKYGICLVLTSKKHRNDEVVSVRVFEACAAGAVIIADEHAFFRKHFGDSILYIDNTKPPEEVFEEVMAHYRWIAANPDKALEKAQRAQAVFHKRFTLQKYVTDLCAQHERRKNAVTEWAWDTKTPVSIVVPIVELDVELDDIIAFNEAINRQVSSSIEVVYVADRSLQERFGDLFSQGLAGGESATVCYCDAFVRNGPELRRVMTRGQLVLNGLKAASHDRICIIDHRVKLTSDHTARLSATLNRSPEADLVYSAYPYRIGATECGDQYNFHFMMWQSALGNGPFMARWLSLAMFRRSFIDRLETSALSQLDGAEAQLLFQLADVEAAAVPSMAVSVWPSWFDRASPQLVLEEDQMLLSWKLQVGIVKNQIPFAMIRLAGPEPASNKPQTRRRSNTKISVKTTRARARKTGTHTDKPGRPAYPSTSKSRIGS